LGTLMPFGAPSTPSFAVSVAKRPNRCRAARPEPYLQARRGARRHFWLVKISLWTSLSLGKAGIWRISVGRSLMIACYGRLPGAILGISFAFPVACSIEAAAQEAGAGSQNGGVC